MTGLVPATDAKAAIDRLAEKRRELGWEDFAAYAFLALGTLGANAPDVLTFILDQADARTQP